MVILMRKISKLVESINGSNICSSSIYNSFKNILSGFQFGFGMGVSYLLLQKKINKIIDYNKNVKTYNIYNNIGNCIIIIIV